jgi:hypothetical protein
MLEAENLKFKISAGQDDSRQPCSFKIINFKTVAKLIDSKDLDEKVKNRLKKMASSYPHQALEGFVRTLDKSIMIAQKEIIKEEKQKPKEIKELEFPE